MKTVIIFVVIFIVFLLLNIAFSLSAQNMPKDIKFGGQNPFEGLKPLGKLSPPLSLEEEREFYKNYLPIVLPEYFLLGIFRENLMGGLTGDLKENRINFFETSEIPLADSLKKYIQKKINITVSLEEDRGGVDLYSAELAAMMKNYLDKNGALNLELFDSEEKIYSYLLGAYYRKGFKINERVYGIFMHNENSIYILLKKARCSYISFHSTKYAIPGSIEFHFEPSVSLKKYLDMIKKEKMKSEKDLTDKVKKKDLKKIEK